MAATATAEVKTKIQFPPAFQCPFCGMSFTRWTAFKHHCKSKHSHRCPACHQSFRRLGAHLWGRHQDPKHLLALVCVFSAVGKNYPTRMRMHALERKVFSDWEYYCSLVRS